MAHVIDSLADRILELVRFVEVSNDDTFDVVEQQQNLNTKRMTESHVQLLKTFLISKNEHRQLQDIPPTDLDIYILPSFSWVFENVLRQKK